MKELFTGFGNVLIFGDSVLVDGKTKGEFIHYSKPGFATVDINGMWNDYPINNVKRL